MASIEKRVRSDGTPGYRITWRYGGVRDGKRQSLTADTLTDARTIRGLVESHSQAVTREQVRLDLATTTRAAGPTVQEWLRRYVASLTGVEGSTRAEYERIIDQHVSGDPLAAMSLDQVSAEHIRLWLLGMRRYGGPKPLAAKSVSNHHVLVSAAMADAVRAGLIKVNPCRGVRLPRADDHTTVEDVVFLTPDQVRVIAETMTSFADVPWLLARTGLRWAEMTALQVGDLVVDGRPRLSVARAWKRQAGGGYAIGPPKTRRSRRTISLDAATAALLRERVAGRRTSAWVVTAPDGVSALRRSTFARHWYSAVKSLVADGMLPRQPRIHDLRHAHASWLIAAGVPLPAIQRRLGHESITTTIDRYGHLMAEVDDQLIAALDAL